MITRNVRKVCNTAFLACCLLAGGVNAQQYKWDTPPYAEDYAFITNDGAWCWFSDPRAIYVNDKMIGGFVDKEGSIWAFSYDPATQERRQYKLKDKFDYDDHANPSVMALPDNRIAIFSLLMAEPRILPFIMRYRKIRPIYHHGMNYSKSILICPEN